MVKIIAQSRRATLLPHPRIGPVIVMGNGPSLRQTIDNMGVDELSKRQLLAVNFAANAPEFSQLRPEWYVLADPLFFAETDAPNVAALRQNLASVSWPMTLIVPCKYRKAAAGFYGCNSNITVKTVNAVGIDAFAWFERWAFKHRLAMPRPRNVLIVSIMTAIWAGYRNIDIVGADHSWMRTIDVDDQNRVVSVQPHFYNDDPAEHRRVASEYAGYRLHDIVHSFYVAFRSYHQIERYAHSRGIVIANCTPHSMIDAFVRKPLQ